MWLRNFDFLWVWILIFILFSENNNNNDLFAKAPKPFGSEIVDNNSAINALTQGSYF